MAEKKPGKGSGNMAVWGLLFVLALALGGGLVFYIRYAEKEKDVAQETVTESTTTTDQVARGDKKQGAVVDLNNKDAKSDQGKEMQRRMDKLGVKKSLDAVVQEEEQVKVGDKTVPMSKILGQIKAKEEGQEPPAAEQRPRIEEEDLGPKKQPQGGEIAVSTETVQTAPVSGQAKPQANEVASAPGMDQAPKAPVETVAAGTDQQDQVSAQGGKVQGRIKQIVMEKSEAKESEEPAIYGIHLVLPGENLWQVHLDFLREYFAKKGIILERGADRPDQKGRSSGVARILKYAERMVFIYSLKDESLSEDLDHIKPNEKIVIFNITRLDRILKKLDAEEIKKVRLEDDSLKLE